EIVRHIQAWVVIISFKLFHSEAHQRVVKARQHKRDEKESVTHLHSRGPSQLSFANFPGESKGSRKPDDKSPMRLEFGNQRLEAINEARRNHPNRHEEQDFSFSPFQAGERALHESQAIDQENRAHRKKLDQ